MSFGDRPPSKDTKPPVPYYLKDDDDVQAGGVGLSLSEAARRYGSVMPKNPDAAAKTKQCEDAIGELDAMKAMGKTLDKLPGGAVRRILSWLADRYGFALVNVDEVAPEPPLGLTRDTTPVPPLERNPVQVVPWTPPNMGTVVCNSMPVWSGE